MLGHLKASLQEFPTPLLESFQEGLINCLLSPPPFFSLANTILSMARMKMDVSQHSVLKQTICSCIPRNIHTVQRSVYWKLLLGLSSLGFKWSALDTLTREALEQPLSQFGESKRLRPKEVATVFDSLRRMRVDWDLLSPQSKLSLCSAIDFSVPATSPHELSIIVNSLGDMGLTWDSLHKSIRDKVLTAVSEKSPFMRSWDLAQLVSGLGMLDAPSSLVEPGSLLEILITNNEKQFGPVTAPSVVQGVSMIQRATPISLHLRSVLFAMVKKWARKMPGIVLFDSLHALSHIFDCELSALPLSADKTSSPDLMQAIDLLFQRDVDDEDFENNLQELKALLPSIQPVNIPNTVYFCHKIGCSSEDLRRTGVWDPLLRAIEESSPRWAPKHEKISMLLNALEKVQIGYTDVPSNTKDVLLHVAQQQLPRMTPRLVSNILYYLARLKFNIKEKAFHKTASRAYFVSCHLMSSSEFTNGLWAICSLLDLSKNDRMFDEKRLENALLSHTHMLNARDVCTLLTSLQVLGYDKASLPSSMREAILDTIPHLSLDATSTAQLLYSLGRMRIEFETLPSFARVAIRESMTLHISTCTPRELFWTVIGCNRMKMTWSTFSDRFKEGFSRSFAINLRDATLKRSSVQYLLKAMSRMSVIWSDLSPEARLSIECSVRIMLRDTDTSDAAAIDLIHNLSRIKSDSSTPLLRRTRNALLLRIVRMDPTSLNHFKLLQILHALKFLNYDISNLPKGFSNNIRRYFSNTFSENAESKVIFAYWRALRDLGLTWADMKGEERKCVALDADHICSDPSLSMSELISVLRGLRLLGANQVEMSAYNNKFPLTLRSAVNKLILENSNIKHGIKFLRYSPGKRISDLSREVELFQNGNIMQQKKAESENLLIQFRKLNAKMTNLSDQEVVRAIFMLGQRVPNKRVPVEELVSSGTLSILDRRLCAIFEDSLSDLQCRVSSGLLPQGLTSGDDRCTSTSLIAVLISIARIGVCADQMPASKQPLLTYFTMISGSIDRRAFIAVARSLIALGINWECFSIAQKKTFSCGIARAASIAPPSRIPTILKHLVGLKIPCDFLHRTIPLVLRYILFRTFTSVVTYDSTGSGFKVSRRAYLEITEHLAAMQTSYAHLGQKASVAMLSAAEKSLLADPSLCNRYIKAIGMICEDAPPEFWRRYILQVQKVFCLVILNSSLLLNEYMLRYRLPQEVKHCLKCVFETAVFGMLNIRPGLLVVDPADKNEQVLVIDFKDTDRFLPFLAYMDVDIDLMRVSKDDKKLNVKENIIKNTTKKSSEISIVEAHGEQNENGVQEYEEQEDMYNLLIKEEARKD